jgi:hypothetical protein
MAHMQAWFRVGCVSPCLAITVCLAGCGSSSAPPPPTQALVTNFPTPTTIPAAAATATAEARLAGSKPAVLAAGTRAFQAAGGGSCHALVAASTAGALGPSLNGIGKLRSARWLVAQIANPCAPGHAHAAGAQYTCSAMPPDLATGATAHAIAAFLSSQK